MVGEIVVTGGGRRMHRMELVRFAPGFPSIVEVDLRGGTLQQRGTNGDEHRRLPYTDRNRAGYQSVEFHREEDAR